MNVQYIAPLPGKMEESRGLDGEKTKEQERLKKTTKKGERRLKEETCR